MSILDAWCISLAVGIIAFLTYQRLARALFSLAILWISTLGAALLYEEAAFRVQAIASKNPTRVEGSLFLLLLVIFFVISYIIVHNTFPVTHLPQLGALDYVMGFFLGTIVAILFVALYYNAIGLMISEPWENYEAWARMSGRYYGSPLVAITREFLRVYDLAFIPFFRTLPPVLIPK